MQRLGFQLKNTCNLANITLKPSAKLTLIQKIRKRKKNVFDFLMNINCDLRVFC